MLAAVVISLGVTLATTLADEHFESGPARTDLLELYTSEGCSSCPPAEAQLSRLKSDPALWKQIVPVAYHVDYWDRLGWRDRFAAPAWTARQNRYASLWQSESVYTPAFVLNGREIRGGFSGGSAPNEKAGRVQATSADGRSWKVDFHPETSAGEAWEMHVALLGAGISSKIDAGENGGRNLEHDFVVLAQLDAPLEASGDHWSGSLTIKPSPEKAPRNAVAIWVTRRGELAPVQATGGWLTGH